MAATTRRFLRVGRRETVSPFSTKHYSADNLASADDRASADDLEIQYHLASADDLESRHKQTADHPTKPTNPERLCPREAVKFNDHASPVAASERPIRKSVIGNSGSAFCSFAFFVFERSTGRSLKTRTERNDVQQREGAGLHLQIQSAFGGYT
jgi:hypothetical protein